VALGESNLRLTQNFFQKWIEQVQNQAQGTREATQGLQEQGQRQREAVETLSQEATNAYSEFLNSALSFYQEAMSTATQMAQGNMQQAAQATQQGMQAASQAGQQAIEAANQAGQQGAQAVSETAQQGAESANGSAQQEGGQGGGQGAQEGAPAESVATGVPIEDYDNSNVGAIVEQLDNLSTEELKRVRAYEQKNKNRNTLLHQIDRRMMVAIGVPIQDYDNSNVAEIVEQLDNLSGEELLATRAYEQENKNRDGLLHQIDRRINAAS
jgi:hypothetical protein